MFFLFSHFIFIDFGIFDFFLFLRVLRLGLPEITIELISSWAALLIILIRFFVLNVSEIVLPLILPEGILFLFLFPVHQVIHFGTSSLSETHLLDCVVFGRQWLWWRLLVTFIAIGVWAIVLALLLVIILWDILILFVLWELLFIDIVFIFIQLGFLSFWFFPFLRVDFLLFGFLFGLNNFFCLFLSLCSGIFSCHQIYKFFNVNLV